MVPGTDRLKLIASAVYPVSGPAILNGAVLIDEDGRIAAVGSAADVPQPEGAATLHLPDALVMPGLVNLHTHLELTTMGGSIEEDDFFAWIQHVRRAKLELPPDDFQGAARQGVRDAWRWGITAVAETGDSGSVVDALTELGGRGVVYHEVFGPHPDDAEGSLARLERTVGELIDRAGDSVTVGVSPHAPYTVSRPLYRRTVEFARANRLPVAVHIAESHAEVDLVTGGKGPFAHAWVKRGIPPFETSRSPISFLDELGVLGPDLLAIHAVRAGPEDAVLLADRGCRVALCPESNLRHGHGFPPIAQFHDAGVSLGLGTDSVASVGSLDLFREMRHVRDRGGLSAEQVVGLATFEGARALNMEGEIGSLDVGKWADLCVVRLNPDAQSSPRRLADCIIDTVGDDILQTYVAGRCVHDARVRH